MVSLLRTENKSLQEHLRFFCFKSMMLAHIDNVHLGVQHIAAELQELCNSFEKYPHPSTKWQLNESPGVRLLKMRWCKAECGLPVTLITPLQATSISLFYRGKP